MANKNLDQIYTANPITSNASTDLMYFMQSPYSSGTDAAMTYVNFAAQFGVPYTPAALTRTNDTNVTLTLSGTPATSLLQAVGLALGWTGELSLARGGTNANLTASANGLVYSTASAMAILATANNGVLITSGAGVPSISSTLPSAVQGNITAVGTIASGTWNGTGITVPYGGTGDSSFTAYMPICGGTTTTGALQSVSTSGASAGYVLTYVSSSALPTWQAAGGGGPWTVGAGTDSAYGGGASSADGNYSLAWGYGSASTGNDSFAFGYQATANHQGSYVWSDSTGNGNSDSGNDQYVITHSGGSTYYAAINKIYGTDNHVNFIYYAGQADQSYSYQTPTTGASITIQRRTVRLVLDPAGTLATLTITMPTSGSPLIDGQLIIISTSQTITSLSVLANSGQTMFANVPTTLLANGTITLIYNLNITTWLPG